MTDTNREAVEQVTPEMQAAWCEYEPVGQFTETMSFARFNGMMRHAFLMGWVAHREHLAKQDRQALPMGVEEIAEVLAEYPCRAEYGSELDGLRRREVARALISRLSAMQHNQIATDAALRDTE